MGKPSGRLGDIGSNHGAWHPSPITSGSGDVKVNGIPAARVGDSLAPHVKPKSKPHGRSIAAGSSTVFINGKPAARVGDAISCGGKVATGSGNVFIGDAPSLLSPTDVSIDLDHKKQKGGDSQYNIDPAKQKPMGPSDKVMIGEPTPEAIVEQPPELKPATIRLAINPAKNMFGADKFILSSTDGSISVTKTVADDLIPGDDFLDLKFDDLDTSLNYKLEHVDGSSGDTYTYFEDFSYGAIGVQSPPADDDDEVEDAE
ncbi:MAG: type VI secretion system PAAR protein [Cellvibrionaceae bacterium]